MRRFGFLGVLAVALLAVVAGVIGYNLGIGANVAASGVAPVAYPVYGWGFGFPLFGLFFFLIFIFVIFAVIRRAFWGSHHGYGQRGSGSRGFGPGGWDRREVPPMADEMLQRWHSRAHSGEPAADGSETRATEG